MSYRLLPKAETDLEQIVDYPAPLSPRAAKGFVARFRARCEMLAGQPRSGSLMEALGEGVRHVVIDSYVALYRIEAEDVVILRVLHGRRDLSPDDLTDETAG